MTLPGLRRYAVELVATFFLTLAVLGAAAQEVVLGAVAIAAAVAAVLAVGAHANPVLTLGSVVARRLAAAELLPCWAAQLVGALLGAALARWLTAAPAVSPLQDVGVLALLVAETLFAFALAFVALEAGLDEEHSAAPVRWNGTGRAAAGAGLVVLAAAAVLDPVAGAAFNPAVAFGEAVGGLAGWGTVWPYLLGCPVGAALAGLVSQLSSRPG
jgi:glycerol uptake facilitator-like aquaporin